MSLAKMMSALKLVSADWQLVHRCWVLVGMICILGYTVNASAIALHIDTAEEGFQHNAVQAAVAFWLTIKLTRGKFPEQASH